MDSLDLYAKIEPFIGFYDEYEELYQRYLALLSPLKVTTVLDIGCGNGKFLKHLQENSYQALGIERSGSMVEIAKTLGVEAKVAELKDIPSNSYECIVAIGDVLNYINPSELDEFFLHVKRVLKPNGYFIADVNTHEGFEIADGVMVNSTEDGFLSIEANFENEALFTEINFFENNNEKYERYQGEVLQYFHPKSYFDSQKFLKLQKSYFHSMFSDADEKEIMVFQKI